MPASTSSAVVNAARSISGRYPNLGPLILVERGIPLVDGVGTLLLSKVREGQPLSKWIEETHAFPDLAVEMIEVGESTGALPAMLTSVAEFYEEDVQTALSAAMSLIEPAILIVMGVVVAAVLLSLYMPIFSLGSGGLQ